MSIAPMTPCFFALFGTFLDVSKHIPKSGGINGELSGVFCRYMFMILYIMQVKGTNSNDIKMMK
jgi:hypothetical protein